MQVFLSEKDIRQEIAFALSIFLSDLCRRYASRSIDWGNTKFDADEQSGYRLGTATVGRIGQQCIRQCLHLRQNCDCPWSKIFPLYTVSTMNKIIAISLTSDKEHC